MIQTIQDLVQTLGANPNPWIVFATIVLSSFVLEDAAAVVSALAVADGRIAMPLAVFSLFSGIALGDLGLFALGRLATNHPWARRWVATEKARGMQAWLDDRLIAAVISVRFLPGARLPTYTACGFLGIAFLRFAIAVILATLAWTAFLFTFALGAGGLIMAHFGVWRWPAGIALTVAVMGTGHAIARMRARRESGKGSAR